MIWEVCGFEPNKWYTMELLKVSKEKLELKLVKKSVGTRNCVKRKWEELSNVLAGHEEGGS